MTADSSASYPINQSSSKVLPYNFRGREPVYLVYEKEDLKKLAELVA